MGLFFGQRLVVIGAGISGLSTALELVRLAPEAEVLVLERSQRPGGLIETLRTPEGYLVEQGPDSLLAWKRSSMDAVRDAGLNDALVTGTETPRRTFVVRGGALSPMPDGMMTGVPTAVMPLLRSDLISAGAKLRLACEPLIRARRDGADESVADFVSRRLGTQVLQHLVSPLVSGIYGADPSQLSMLASMPHLAELERQHGSLAWGLFRTRQQRGRAQGKPQVLSLAGGMDTLTSAMAHRLGSGLRLGVEVRGVGHGSTRRFEVRCADSTIDCDGVVLAAPAHASAQLLSELDPDLAQMVDAIVHGPLCSVSIAFRADQIPQLPAGTGFLVPTTERRPTTACTFMSHKWPGRAPQDQVLLRSFVALPGTATEDDVLVAALSDLRDLLGIEVPPVWSHVRRRERGLPRYAVEHGARIGRIEQRCAQLGAFALAGNALRGIGMSECVDSGRRAAACVINALSPMGPAVTAGIADVA